MLAVDESFLAPLGIHRIATPVPFLEAGGPANAYALEEGGGTFTLFDCGLGTDEGLAALRAGLHARGLELKNLSRIVISHGHPDHFGNAQTLAEETGADVFVHPHDLEKICGDGRWSTQLSKHWIYMLKLGVPEPMLSALLESTRNRVSHARIVERARVKVLEEGMRLKLLRFDAQVLHMPGHTPGLVCLWLERERVLLADDHVLAKISPNPTLDLSQGEGETKFKSLVAYYASAKRAQAMDIACVLPGHGEAFSGHRALLESLFSFYTARQQRLCKRLADAAEPLSVFTLMQSIFPRVDVSRLYLMLSEALGNIEVLEVEGKLKRVETDTTLAFELVVAH